MKIYRQSINLMANSAGRNYKLDVYEDITQNMLNGKHYTIEPTQQINKKPTVNGKIFIKNNRVYSISYIGRGVSGNEFLDSFKTIK